jgi:hypothetical protein
MRIPKVEALATVSVQVPWMVIVTIDPANSVPGMVCPKSVVRAISSGAASKRVSVVLIAAEAATVRYTLALAASFADGVCPSQ